MKKWFLPKNGWDIAIILALVFINGLVLYNALIHNPKMGYDGLEHLKYIRVLPERLPTPQDTYEFFSPPVAYFLPSLADQACPFIFGDKPFHNPIFRDCTFFAAKFGQILNFILSLGVTFSLLKISEILKPGNAPFKFSVLVLLGILPVYYKTFSQIRGEPYVFFFVTIIAYFISRFIYKPEETGTKHSIWLGIILGLLILSRQWGFMIFPALGVITLFVLIKDRILGWKWVRISVIAVSVAFLTGGWFYINNYLVYGTFTTFNQKTKAFSFSNQRLSFYRNTGLDNFLLFKSPTRPTFDNQLFPILYSETWGDYWGYFTFIRDKSYLGEGGFANQAEISPYLGRVNLVSEFPSLLFGMGILSGVLAVLKQFRRKGVEAASLYALFNLAFIAATLLGYLWFLISHPVFNGVTIKTTYILQVFIPITLLTAGVLDMIRAKSRLAYNFIVALLLLITLHNLPAMITRYSLLIR
jgi:hypothetical protein